jgi:hypothetical protein
VIAETLIEVGDRLEAGVPKSHATRSIPLRASLAA